ncbi:MULTISPECIES: hypothetical protein [Acinetobacter]|uniref:Uncharacterized protein n=1 Tax=Acinetobacter johnsonii TaxID=40214 RepID=A0AAW6RRF6_ACIJO|nr:hypothetical protein [Acinetobacter johnsonii]MDG9785879.1 hypothetical protein [Acinetobacter johnsonii]MDG9797862.1 hypothetical protein [Acinetobacter johnsonii]MDH1531010.1 hypothetical protein [Acinetobacter johnsonii]
MSDFEEYIKVNYPRDYERQKRIYPDQRVEELYSEDYKMWNHQQTIIDDLKAQLNNMEQCYIGKKKQVEAVEHVLCELKESMVDFREMDLYDKGHRVTTEYVITDLEEALRGAND